MKLPNGYGSVYKLSGKRRNPFIARKTIGFTDTGKQIYSTVGYYKTRTDALQALAEYNNDPYDLLMSKLTFEQVYDKWMEETFDEDTNVSTLRNYSRVFKHCTSLYKMKFADIRIHHLQSVIDSVSESYNTAERTKVLFNKLYSWAIFHEYVQKNLSENLKLPKKEKKEPTRTAISKKDIETF